MQFTTSDGFELAVQTYGPDDARVTVFLAHGWVLDHEHWRYQVRDLQARFGHEIEIVTWDHRGHGGSGDVTREGARLELLAKDMGEVIDRFAPTGTLVLAGHSMGGMTLMALAEQQPELLERTAGVVLLATSSGRLNTVTLGLPEMGATLRRQLPRVFAMRSRLLSKKARRRAPVIERVFVRRFLFGHPMRLADAALAVEALLACSANSMMGYYDDLMRHDRVGALKQFDGVPTDIVVGERDLLTPLDHAKAVAEHLPDAEFTVLPEAGHMLPLERDAEITALLVKHVERALVSVDPRDPLGS